VKNAVIGDAKSLHLSPVQAIYHVFGMGKTTIFGYKTNSAYSPPKMATTLIIRAPLILNSSTDANSHLRIESTLEESENWMTAVRQKTVLCVDDETIGLRVRKIMLESHGFHVLTATDGQQGIALFERNKVDLVVLDFYMPGLNGGQVAAELRRRRPRVPIIFLSAYFSLPSDALEMADAFITKGEPPEVLIEKIEQLM
jgi:CheY-like chemotaxis protein